MTLGNVRSVAGALLRQITTGGLETMHRHLDSLLFAFASDTDRHDVLSKPWAQVRRVRQDAERAGGVSMGQLLRRGTLR